MTRKEALRRYNAEDKGTGRYAVLAYPYYDLCEWDSDEKAGTATLSILCDDGSRKGHAYCTKTTYDIIEKGMRAMCKELTVRRYMSEDGDEIPSFPVPSLPFHKKDGYKLEVSDTSLTVTDVDAKEVALVHTEPNDKEVVLAFFLKILQKLNKLR